VTTPVQPTSPFRLAVLLSGSGSNLQALLDARAAGVLPAEIAVVLSDRAGAYGLQRALNACIPALYVPLNRPVTPAGRAAWEQTLADVLAPFAPDLVLLAGFMRVLSPIFLDRFPDRVINQHPALLPADGGATVVTRDGTLIPALRGAHVVADAIRLRLPISGCTIHRVTPVVDDGPLLATAEVPVLPTDTAETLHERIKAEERRLVVAVVTQLALARG
jgi:phosphoribosylglycinamide formyltransferase 1